MRSSSPPAKGSSSSGAERAPGTSISFSATPAASPGPSSSSPTSLRSTLSSDVFPLFQHSGHELIYMLEGEVVYRHADKLYAMKPGDSLFFDADAPHGPEELTKLPIRFLSIISYAREPS